MPAKNTNSNTKQTTLDVTATTGKTQKGGKKTTVVETAPEPTPVVETTVTTTTGKTQKGGKKTTVVETATAPAANTTPATTTTTATASKTQKGGKKATPVVETTPVPVVETVEVDDSNDRKIRSFKVKLPGSEEFEGRFTGLTPYQAANKALSKYFRETDEPQAEITFSICESTRKSRKATYTYVGRRQKLDTPVTYTIQDGREIVKNFKNSLKKVKKSESPNETA